MSHLTQNLILNSIGNLTCFFLNLFFPACDIACRLGNPCFCSALHGEENVSLSKVELFCMWDTIKMTAEAAPRPFRVLPWDGRERERERERSSLKWQICLHSFMDPECDSAIIRTFIFCRPLYQLSIYPSKPHGELVPHC